MSLKYKTGNICISPEDCSLNYGYCFTFNPQIQPLDVEGSKNANSSLWQFSPHDDLKLHLKTWYVACRNLFESMRGCKIYDMVVEISDKGRYHFHGRLKITDIMDFYTFDIPILDKKAHYCICQQLGDAPSDKEVKYKTWDEYLNKQQQFMKPYLLKHGIKYDDKEIDEELSDKYTINRQGRLKERSKEIMTKKCRICKEEYKTTLKKSVVCNKCDNINTI